MQIPFVGPSYTLKSMSADCQRTINMYVDVNEIGSTSEFNKQMFLVGTPGLKEFIRPLETVENDAIRAIFVNGADDLFVVCNNSLVQIIYDPLEEYYYQRIIGKLSTNEGRVSIADNGFQLALTDGPNYYIYNYKDEVFSLLIPDGWEDIGTSRNITYFESYFIIIQDGSQKFYISSQYDGTKIDALDFASAEASPDNLVACVSLQTNLWLFGERSTEIFANTGSADFPFTKMSGGYVKVGCVAPYSVAVINDAPIWLGRDEAGSGIVYIADNGYTPRRLSNFAVENSIQNTDDISNATAYTYQENGHYFYVLNFPNANTTWCYDMTTEMWHERQYYNTKIGQAERHRSEMHVYWRGMHLVADYKKNIIYEMSLNHLSDNGDSIQRIRRSPQDEGASMQNLTYSEFELNIDTGSFYNINYKKIPQISLRYSNDNGKTWSNYLIQNLWEVGNYDKRIKWNRLGTSRKRVWEISITDPVPVTILGARVIRR